MRSSVIAAWLLATVAAAAPVRSVCATRPTGPFHVPRGFQSEIVAIECTDGYHLAADFIRRQRQPRKMAGVIFLHEAGRDRHSWYPLTIQSARRGMAVLALDLLGNG